MKILQGPEIGQAQITGGLDYYKPTMSQVEYLKHPDTQVTFEFKNRGSQDLLEYVDPKVLTARLSRFKSGWSEEEVNFLRTQERRDGQPLFKEDFLQMLLTGDLPPVEVGISEEGTLQVTSTGAWPLETFWETIVMSEINELYFETMIAKQDLDVMEIYEEGDRRLTEKIEILKSRPDIKFADFGTRRRFSYRWHKHVLSRLTQECPDNLVGTSNVWLAKEFGLMPIGTFAHEMPMVYAALADKEGRDPLDGHHEMLMDWQEVYDNNLSTALTDTFGSEFFFADFTPEQAKHWQGLRHDSGEPIAFGEKVIEFYKSLGIDPTEKTIVFSDGLDINEIIKLADYFKGRVKLVFGWGTTLTNDLGIPALNIVMKAVEADGIGTVKLSDNPGKEMGDPLTVNRYHTNAESKVATSIHLLESAGIVL